MNDTQLRWMTTLFEGLPHGSVIMADESYLKCHPDRMSNDNECLFIPSYSLGAFSAREVAEMILDANCGWKITTPDN